MVCSDNQNQFNHFVLYIVAILFIFTLINSQIIILCFINKWITIIRTSVKNIKNKK